MNIASKMSRVICTGINLSGNQFGVEAIGNGE